MKSLIAVFVCGFLVAEPSRGLEVKDNSSHAGPDSTLLQAAEKNDSAQVRVLLGQGSAVDAENAKGWTALTFAAKAGNREMVELLVQKGANVNHKSSTTTGSTVLCFAVEGNNPAVINCLLAHGADINGKSRDGMTPLAYASAHSETNIADLLISKGADINLAGPMDDMGRSWTPLMAAANREQMESIKLLLSRGAGLEQTNNHGDTALMEACKRDVPDAVKLLIEKGANVNARGPFGHTALIFAAYNGQVENVRMLLAAGADPFATATDSSDPGSPDRYSAGDLAMQQSHPESLALIDAAAVRIRANRNKTSSTNSN